MKHIITATTNVRAKTAKLVYEKYPPHSVDTNVASIFDASYGGKMAQFAVGNAAVGLRKKRDSNSETQDPG